MTDDDEFAARRDGRAAPTEISLADMEVVRGGCAGASAATQEEEPQAKAPEKKADGFKKVLGTVLPMITSALGGGTGAT